MEPSENEYAQQRRELVDELRRSVPSEKVLRAIDLTPRHKFIPAELRLESYRNQALSIGFGQTISQPQIVALMTEALDVNENDRILEIGLGSGYQAAVLSKLVRDVYSIELVQQLGEKTNKLLRELEYRNIHVRIGDGSFGWPEEAPFDGIMVTAAPADMPLKLVDQLKEGGRIVIPLGTDSQRLKVFTKKNGELVEKDLGSVRFVPMLGDSHATRSR